MDEKRKILEKLVVKKIGLDSTTQAKELTNSLSAQDFSAYLLKGSEGCTVPRSDYQPRVLNTYSGEHYYRPDGWVQFQWPSNFTRKAEIKMSAVEMAATPSKCKFLNEWPVAYHGTSVEKLPSILNQGLRNPSRAANVEIAHGQAGAGGRGAIYLTPSLWLAAHPVYAPLFQMSPGHWVQFVVKLRVRPGSFKRQGNTLGLGHYSNDVMYDPNLVDGPQEWLLKKKEDLRIVGIMMREFGKCADAKVYGHLVRQVVPKRREGVEFQWTKLLCEALRSGNFLATSGIVSQTVSGQQIAGLLPKQNSWWKELGESRFDEIIGEVQHMPSDAKPLYTVTSPTFDLDSIGKARWTIAFRPVSDGDPTDGKVIPVLCLHLPPGSQFSLLIDLNIGQKFVCSYDQCALEKYTGHGHIESDSEEVLWYFAFKQQYFRSMLPNLSFHVAERFEVAGSISVSDDAIKWTLLIGDHAFGRSVHSPAFRLGDARTARLELYPRGHTFGASDCALYLWPGGVGAACRLTIASTSRILDNRLDSDAKNEDAHWGFASFCHVDSMSKNNWCTVTVESDPDPSHPPLKRLRGAPAHLGA